MHGYDVLREVMWFGSAANANDTRLIDDPLSLEFSTDTKFTTMLVASDESDLTTYVEESVAQRLGHASTAYASSSYDAIWLLGLALERTQSTDVDALAEAIPEVARERVGALGDLDLNAAGDLAQANYDILRVTGGGWQYYGTYEATSDSIAFAAMDGDADGEKATGGEAMTGDSTADDEKATGGCLIATAAYGSELALQVQLLREIRDATLLPTASGAYFMAGFNQMYYSFSPAIADLERENPAFREAVRVAITPAMYAMSVMTLADPGSEASVLAFGMLSIGAVAGMYLVGPYLVVRAVKRRARQGWCKNVPAPQPYTVKVKFEITHHGQSVTKF